MLKFCGCVLLLLGSGGFVFAACNKGSGSSSATGPEWMYSRF